MDLNFRPVMETNRKEVEALELLPEQQGFIESVRECMLEADRKQEWRPVGIYDGELLIGFAMYGHFGAPLPAGEVWLDRMLIDRRYQGRGYGKAAVPALLQRLHQEYGTRQVYLSVYENNAAAIALYQELGFCFNGELDYNGEKVMVCPLRNH